MCEQPVAFPQTECACGELLTPWWKLIERGRVLRQKGLHRAAQGEYLEALVAFLEDTLTNPLDRSSLVDAARALVHLNKPQEALRLLQLSSPQPESKAATLAQAIKLSLKQAQTHQQGAEPRPKMAPGTPPSPSPSPFSAVEPGPHPLATPAPPELPRHRAPEPPKEKKTPSPVAEAPPAAEEEMKPPSPKSRPSFMALGVVPRQTKKRLKVLGGAGKMEVPEGWKTILDLEQNNQEDWGVLLTFLTKRLFKPFESGLDHYVLGLARWQKGLDDEALEEFGKCLAKETPVLNPAFYFLYLHLGKDTKKVNGAWKQLFEWLGEENYKPFKKQLAQKLKEWNDQPRLKLLDGLAVI